MTATGTGNSANLIDRGATGYARQEHMMNDPRDYYDETTNTYDFTGWCLDHHFNPVEIFDFNDHPAVTIASRMHNHNVAEAKWKNAQPDTVQTTTRTRPNPFHTVAIYALAMLAGLFSTLAPVVALAVL